MKIKNANYRAQLTEYQPDNMLRKESKWAKIEDFRSYAQKIKESEML